MKRVLRIIVIVLMFIVLFIFLNMLLQPKYMDSLVEGSMISQYYGEPKDHEVLFIGDCEVYANFSPMVLFEEQGIKAYVRGSSQQLIWQSYYILKETLKYEIPKVVIFNVNSMRYDRASEEISEAYNRLTIDKMRWSREKVGIILDSMTEEETFLSYVFPILRYHSRFDELTSEDFKYLFKRKNNTYNGFLINKNINGVTVLPTKRKLANYDFSSENYDYLNKIKKLCDEYGIELILIKAPSLYPYWYDEYEEQIVEYSRENDVDYYNFINLASVIGIDYSMDTYDGGLHLNLSGATKLSKYFAEILMTNYNLTNYRGDDIYEDKLQDYNMAIQ